MSCVILFNKPYGVLCQFSPQPGRSTLKAFIPHRNVYPAGRLDADSEGLVVLTDDGRLQHRLADPACKMPKVYVVQVEGVPSSEALRQLRSGIELNDFTTQEAQVDAIEEPAWLWPRTPAVRFRRLIPTSWLRLSLHEGKNRQLRRMTAAVGLPTLRLVRYGVGDWTLEGLSPGTWHEADLPQDHSVGLAAASNQASPGDVNHWRTNNVRGRAIPLPLKRKKR